MSLDGVWVLEVAGISGWERVATVFLEKGRYLSGNANFFSHGSYIIKNKNAKMSINVTRHDGAEVTVFGEKSKKFAVEFEGKKRKKIIEGFSRLKDAHSSVAVYPTRIIKITKLKEIKRSKKK
ncbi:MAG: hypothetical protein KAI02_04710 [Gammaproteobacteria bacterium]|nr:hypothetical protein [Gammaproteobacteria bacterium]